MSGLAIGMRAAMLGIVATIAIALSSVPHTAAKDHLRVAKPAEMPMFFTNAHFDRKAVEVVNASLIELGQIDKLPPDKDLITEQFLN